MEYLAARNDAGELRRAALANVAPWARSVVVCAANYNSDTPYSTQCDDPARGWISRYAFVETDYHELLLARLRRIERRMAERIVADPAAPISAHLVLCGHRPGGGTRAGGAFRHWMDGQERLHPQSAAWFVAVSRSYSHLARAAARSARRRPLRRLHPLPGRLPHPGFDCAAATRRRRCISYLTIEQRGAAPEELRAKMGRHLFGCDICQDVCPWNRRAPASPDPAFAPRTELVNPSLEWISGMNEEEFRRTFRGSPVKRAKLADCCATPPLPWATAESENICRVCASWRGSRTRRSPNMRAGRLQDWRRQPMPTLLGSQSPIYASRLFSRSRLDLRARLLAQRPTGERIVARRARSMFHAAAPE